MHKPSSSSNELNIQSFGDAYMEWVKDSVSTEWIYVPCRYDEYRYILGTIGNNPLICIGINPSTAEPGNLDNTLKSVDRIARANGFDSFIMFNVYAQRATSPDDMDKELNMRLHEENMKAFRNILDAYSVCDDEHSETPTLWAAWGNIIEKRKYLTKCVSDMIEIAKEYDARWVNAGKISVKGHPHHPLYLKKDEPIKDFDIESYVRRFKDG